MDYVARYTSLVYKIGGLFSVLLKREDLHQGLPSEIFIGLFKNIEFTWTLKKCIK